MKIVTLGSAKALKIGSYLENIPLLGVKHVGDVDIFLLELEAVGQEITDKFSKKNIPEELYELFCKNIVDRMSEVRKVTEAGSPLIVFLDSTPQYFEVDNDYDSNWRTDWAAFWPFSEVELISSAGTSLKSKSNLSSTFFRDEAVGKLSFNVCIKGNELGFPLLEVPTKVPKDIKFAGWVIPTGKSYVAFFPISFLAEDNSYSNIPGLVGEIYKEIKARKLAIQRPSWLIGARDMTDTPLVSSMHEQSAKIIQLQRDFDTTQVKLEATEWKYGLLFETGGNLEECVRRALAELGAIVESGPSNRADFVGIVGNTLVYGEVKGLDGAAQESALVQLAKWKAEIEEALFHWEESDDDLVSQYHAILKKLDVYDESGKAKPGIELKGLVVVNTFRQKPLNERPSLSERKHENFPVVFESKLKSSSWVGITSVQLFSMLGSLHGGSWTDLKWEELFSTNGVFESYTTTADLLTFDTLEAQRREKSENNP